MKEDRTTVTVIFRKKSAVLVEYMQDDVPVRVSLPASSVKEISGTNQAEVYPSVLEAGIPYGIPIASMIGDFSLKGSDIEKEFHKSGIWTYADFKSNPKGVLSSIYASSIEVAKAIQKMVKKYADKEA